MSTRRRNTTTPDPVDFGFLPPPPANIPPADTATEPPAAAGTPAGAAADPAPGSPADDRAAGDTAASATIPEQRAAGTAAKKTTPARKKRRSRRRTAADDEGTGVYLPLALRERLRAYQRLEGGSYTNITLDAVEATHEDLTIPVPERQTSRSGPLFVGRPRRQRMPHADAHVQVNLRFAADDRDTLDEIVEAKQAPNRSALIAAALDTYLPPAEELGLHPDGRPLTGAESS